MSGISEGNIYSGIAQGINQAGANILNLYGLKQRMDLQRDDLAQRRDLQQQQLDIQKQNADTYRKRAIRADFGSPARWQFGSPAPTRQPRGAGLQGTRLGVDASLDVDPRYLQPGADALR